MTNRMSKNCIVFSLLLPLLVACSRGTTGQTDSPAPLMLTDSLQKVVSVETVHEAPLNNELLLNGRVSFNPEQVAHVYPIFGGNITEVSVEIGDYVKKGDVLAVIHSSEVADYAKQKKEAEQQLMLADRNLEATQDMFRSGMASERDVLQAEQDAANARAEQKRIDEVYAIYNIEGNSTYGIKSPVSGFVIEKNVSRNMQIRSDQTEEMFTISGLDNVWVMADVYESDISKVREGAPVRITTLAYGDKEFAGTIDKVYNMLNDESKTMSVRVKLKNEDYMLKPGMFTNVYVECNAEGQVMARVHAHAVIFENGKQYVVYIGDDNRLHAREVTVFKQTETYCYLQSGLKEGDRIIDRNALLVYNALK